MKAHKYWSLGALAAMIGTFYTGYKNNDIEKAQSLNSLSFLLSIEVSSTDFLFLSSIWIYHSIPNSNHNSGLFMDF